LNTLVNFQSAQPSKTGQFSVGANTIKARCCPNTPVRKIARSIHESARQVARDIAKTEAYQ